MFYGTGIQSGPFHLVRGRVIRLKSHGVQTQFIGLVHIRMSDVDSSVENTRPPEHDIIRPRLVGRQNVFYAIEPNQVHNSLPIGEMSHQTPFPPLSLRIKAQYLAANLYVGHIGRQLMDIIKPRTVYMFIRKGVQQIMQSTDLQFISEQFGTLRSHSRQELDILTLKVYHRSIG